MPQPTLLALAATLLLTTTPLTAAESMYPKTSPVLSIDSSTYGPLIARSNHTTILEFYAPWCGHCKNLKPAYEKAAKSLAGLAKVAAINCDDEANKPFCGQMGVQGFPTLKIVRPGKKVGRPVVEDYQGPRTAKGIVEAVVEKIPNHVKRVKDGDYEAWLEEGDGAKAILFSDKGTVSALLKSIAIEFLGGIEVAMIRDKEREAVEVFGVKKFPTLVLLPGGEAEPVVYEGEMKKEGMVKFLSQAVEPNPDPAPKEKKGKSGDKKKASKAAKDKSKKAEEAKTSQSETIIEDNEPIPSPDPKVESQKPISIPTIEAIPTLADGLTLEQKCLNSASKTCILALFPPSLTTDTDTSNPAVSILSEIHHKHTQAKRNLFPFYQIPASNQKSEALTTQLGIDNEAKVVIIAINGKKGWWNRFNGENVSVKEVENWIEGIRMGDGKREKLPSNVIVDVDSLPEEIPVVVEKTEEAKENEKEEESQAECPMGHGKKKAAEEHDEL